jgi:dTDP-glucose 4,6-dehydratase
MENKKVLLSGISGSIGCHFLAHIFHNTDWDVIGISTFRHRGESDRIVEILKNHPEWSKRLTMIMHDLIGPFSERTKQKIGKVDYIINLASLSDVEASIHDPITFIQNNVWSTLNMLEYAREVKPEAFIQFSTDEVYGPTMGKNDGYKEWDAQVPSNPYAGSKSAQESIAISYWRTYNNSGEATKPLCCVYPKNEAK